MKPFKAGANEDFKKRLKYFQRLAQAHQWSDEDKRRILPYYLQEPADIAYEELTDADKVTFKTMVTKLKEKFNDLAAQMLFGRKQKEGASAVQIANEVQA